MFFDGIDDDFAVFDVFLSQNREHIYQWLTVHIEITQTGEVLLFDLRCIRHFLCLLLASPIRRTYTEMIKKKIILLLGVSICVQVYVVYSTINLIKDCKRKFIILCEYEY